MWLQNPVSIINPHGILQLSTCRHIFSSEAWCSLQFPRKNDVRLFFTPICYVEGSCFFVLFIYAYWCPKRFSCQMIFVSFNSNTTVSPVEQELSTLLEHLSSPPFLSALEIVDRPFVLFILAILLSVLLQFTDYDYLQTLIIRYCELRNQMSTTISASTNLRKLEPTKISKTSVYLHIIESIYTTNECSVHFAIHFYV